MKEDKFYWATYPGWWVEQASIEERKTSGSGCERGWHKTRCARGSKQRASARPRWLRISNVRIRRANKLQEAITCEEAGGMRGGECSVLAP